jgi:hypothetical protein
VLVASDIFATDPNAEALILATNKPVMPLNGFSSYPLTITELTSLVADGTVRFFLLGQGQSLGRFPGGGGPTLGSVRSWVAQHCTTVPPRLWQPSLSSSQAGENDAAVLYDCATLH